jgi:hypothetical protein
MTEPPPPRLVTAELAALYVRTTWKIPTEPTTVRSWASRKRISNHGARFDLNEIDKYIRKRLGLKEVAS